MREIASFEDERTARAFADVLCARQIGTDVSKTRYGYAVWVLEEKHVEVARAAWAAFDANPEAPEHLSALGCVEKKQRKEEVEQRRSRHEVIDVRSSWHGTPVRPPAVTLVLVVFSIAATLGATVARRPELISFLMIGFDDEPPFQRVLHGEVWRLVTPIFVHYGLLHILFNMWWLLDLGSVIENRIGAARFTALVLVSAALSNAAQYAVAGPLFGGMSGVLYALFGYVWVRGRLDPAIGLAMPRSTATVLLIWLALGFTGVLGHMANIAHLGGLAAGALLGALGARGKR